MQKLPIKRTVEGLLRLQDTGTSATLLGIGPMSSNLLQAAFELGRDDDFPLMFLHRAIRLTATIWEVDMLTAGIRSVSRQILRR